MNNKIPEIDKAELIKEKDAITYSGTWLTQKIFTTVKEEVYQRGTFTVFVIHAVSRDDAREYEGVGFAKARPDITISQYDADKGREVARGRAVYDLFEEFKKNRTKVE